ncbi:MAG: hypothetical protein M1832_005392 [Thelocarpon impressellum]|nr:MAG: hypothetical protein M1832_005392 [Thelocarpon impressellum]
MDKTSPMGREEVELLIPKFQLIRILNQDQAGRRLTLLGKLQAAEAIMVFERTALPTSEALVSPLPSTVQYLRNLGHNDIYAWYLASSPPSAETPDLKINLIWPATQRHVQKYERQGVKVVTETKDVYAQDVRPWVEKQRGEGRLDWVYNILDGRTEVEDVILRDEGGEKPDEGFLLLPDLNWDRKTLPSLHLLALVFRRDIWSLRDLQKAHVPWLTAMRRKIIDAVTTLYPSVGADELKLYMHYQPTYYHFHVHVVHAALDPGATQATGKAFGLENTLAWLAGLPDGAGLADVSLTYTLGDRSPLWTDVFGPLAGRADGRGAGA